MTILSHRPLLAGAMLLGTLVAGQGQEGEQELLLQKLERENRQLKRELESLRQGYQATLTREEQKTKSLAEIKEQLALFGRDFFEGGDERLRNAVADYQVAREKQQELEAAGTRLINSVQIYLQSAVAADPEARAQVESDIRELEAGLGYRKKPSRQLERGTPQNALIVSIDNETGVSVINAGATAKVGTGMRFRIERAGQHIADATVALTRDDVSGLFINNLLDNNNPVRPGDTARVIIESSQP